MQGPNVAVVTPVHNGAEHLAECIESVLAQTYDSWTLTVVDNASTDATPEIVERYATRDDRVRLIRCEEFLDVNANHNRAFATVEEAAPYCKPLQADDLLYPRCLELTVALALMHSVGIVGAYRMNGEVIDLKGVPVGTDVVSGPEILRQSLLGGPYVTGTPTSLLLRTELLKGRRPFWDLTFEHADTEAAYWAFTRSDFGLVHEVLTFTRRQPGTRFGWSDRVNSFEPENIRMLVRYGPSVLTPAEYRRRLRLELRKYLWWLAKQRLLPARWNDDEYHHFHWEAWRLLLKESGNDRDVRAALLAAQPLLRRPSSAKAVANGRWSRLDSGGRQRPADD